MSEENAKMNKERALTELIRKELGSNTNRRFLARMNAFKPEGEMPENFRMLLNELDRAEGSR